MTGLNHLRRRIVEVAANAGEGHIPSALSILDIVHVLHWKAMAFNERGDERPLGDHFILSKGHGSLALYAVLEELSVLNLDDYCQPGGLLGHPERNVAAGIEATTGSLGHGFPMAVGLAYGLRLQKSDARVFCLVGDQELNEGSCWEAIMLAARFALSNLVLIVDDNGSATRSTPMIDLTNKFAAFDWAVFRCDGHDHRAIAQALDPVPYLSPLVVVAKTVKGKGIARMEQDPNAWHHRTPNPVELQNILEELEGVPA